MTTVDHVVAVVVALVAESGSKPVPDGDLPNLPLTAFGLDSLDKFTLLIRIEDAFGVSLDEPAALACTTCAELAILVESTLASNGAVQA